MNDLEIITHIHTEASGGPASTLDQLVTGSIRSVLGPDYTARWKECFNTPAEVCSSLRPLGPVSMIFMTDHINEKYFRLSPKAVELASRDPRIAVGAEIQTWSRDAAGEVIGAPEVLVYGRVEPSASAAHTYSGISEEDLEILFKECSIDETGRADIRLVRDYCILNGYAHALAHPFDGSRLGLEKLLDVITDFKFVETVNGGFPADSSKRLSSFVSWYNKASDGLIDEAGLKSGLLRKMRRKARDRGPIHPWGGSDAHAGNHDRVVVLYKTGKEEAAAADLFGDMVERDVRDLLDRHTFSISGTPATPITLIDDVTRIAFQNVLRHMDLIKDTTKLLEVISKVRSVTMNEIAARRRRKKTLITDFDETIGHELRLGLMQARRRIRREEAPAPQDATRLPERLP